MHTHTPKSVAQTRGFLICWASGYDRAVDLLTLGQAQRLRAMTIDLAALEPGERLHDVGCGTGAVTVPGKQRVGRYRPPMTEFDMGLSILIPRIPMQRLHVLQTMAAVTTAAADTPPQQLELPTRDAS